MNTTHTRPPGKQSPMLDPSCHLALDVIDLFATGLGGKQKSLDSLQTGFDKVIRSLESVKALTLSASMQQKKKWMAELEQIKKVQAQYPSSKESLFCRSEPSG